MDLTVKELGMIAEARVAPPYKRRIVAASGIAAATLIGVGIPDGSHVWQLISIVLIIAVYLVYLFIQAKTIERKRCELLKEMQSELMPAGDTVRGDEHT